MYSRSTTAWSKDNYHCWLFYYLLFSGLEYIIKQYKLELIPSFMFYGNIISLVYPSNARFNWFYSVPMVKRLYIFLSKICVSVAPSGWLADVGGRDQQSNTHKIHRRYLLIYLGNPKKRNASRTHIHVPH